MKWLLVPIVAAIVAGGAVAYAATAPVTASSITSAVGAVSACDPSNAWTHQFTKDVDGRVASVQIGGIASACNGGIVRLTLVGPTSSTSADPVTISSCASTCTVAVPIVTGRPYPSAVTSVHAVVVGP